MTDRQTSNCIKGIAAVMVMLGHITSGMPLWIRALFSGDLWVGIFFFYSGYGLITSLRGKGAEYLDGFLLKKIRGIWLPFIIAESIYTLVYIAMNGFADVSAADVILGCLGLRLYNSVLWYVDELMVMNIIFFVWYRCVKSDKRFGRIPVDFLIWPVLYVVFLACGVLFDIGTWWYISTSTFVIGILCGELRAYKTAHTTADVSTDARSKPMPIRVIALILFVIAYAAYRYLGLAYTGDAIFGVPVNYLLTAMSMLLVPWFVWSIDSLVGLLDPKVVVNKVTAFLGSVSYDIYLYHGLLILIVNHYIFNILLCPLLVLVGTLLVAAAIRAVSRRA